MKWSFIFLIVRMTGRSRTATATRQEIPTKVGEPERVDNFFFVLFQIFWNLTLTSPDILVSFGHKTLSDRT